MARGIQRAFVVHSMGIRVRKRGIQQISHLEGRKNPRVWTLSVTRNVPEFAIIILEGKRHARRGGVGNPSRGSFLEFYMAVSSCILE